MGSKLRVFLLHTSFSPTLIKQQKPNRFKLKASGNKIVEPVQPFGDVQLRRGNRQLVDLDFRRFKIRLQSLFGCFEFAQQRQPRLEIAVAKQVSDLGNLALYLNQSPIDRPDVLAAVARFGRLQVHLPNPNQKEFSESE